MFNDMMEKWEKIHGDFKEVRKHIHLHMYMYIHVHIVHNNIYALSKQDE